MFPRKCLFNYSGFDSVLNGLGVASHVSSQVPLQHVCPGRISMAGNRLHPMFPRKCLFNNVLWCIGTYQSPCCIPCFLASASSTNSTSFECRPSVGLHPMFPRKCLFNMETKSDIEGTLKLHPMFPRKCLFNTIDTYN